MLTTLVSVSPIYASFDADERVVTRALKELQADGKSGATRGSLDRIPVQMGTAGTTDAPFTGKLQLVDNQVDARSGTVRVRAVFDNADGSPDARPVRPPAHGPGQGQRGAAGQRARGRHRPKQEVRAVVGADNKAPTARSRSAPRSRACAS